MDSGRRPYIQTLCRVNSDHQLRLMADLTGKQQLLLIAAGQLLHRSIEFGRLNVKTLHQLL
ncbi:hypothetical protein D3C85_1935890 [compost metagenome]